VFRVPQPRGLLHWLLDSVHRSDAQAGGAMKNAIRISCKQVWDDPSEFINRPVAFSALVIFGAGAVVFIAMAIGFMAGMAVGR
jgi:hypothetical protein